MRFSLDQQPIELTAAQFRLLTHLYQNAGNLCTRESCAAAIWGRDYDPGMDAAALIARSPTCATCCARLTPAPTRSKPSAGEDTC